MESPNTEKTQKDIVAAHEPTHPVPQDTIIPPPISGSRIVVTSSQSTPPPLQFPPRGIGRRLDEPDKTKFSYTIWFLIGCLNLYLLVGPGILIFFYVAVNIFDNVTFFFFIFIFLATKFVIDYYLSLESNSIYIRKCSKIYPDSFRHCRVCRSNDDHIPCSRFF